MTTTRSEFHELARTYRAIPVHRQLLADLDHAGRGVHAMRGR